MKNFNEKCYQLLLKVPKGRVTTYKAIANALGTNAYRAVGNAMNKNTNIPMIPCHRVVGSNGFLTGYALGLDKKIQLLNSENVQVKNNKILDFKDKLFSDFNI
jgi:methylated-DNA-[protein]-cysteine S-methyltransferase